MLITPRISEKSYKLVGENIYVFNVPIGATKAEVTKAVMAEHPDVKIADVRLLITKGKVKAVNRGKHARPSETTHKDTKKAYVTLSDGKIEVAAFEQTDYAEAEAAANDTKATATRDISANTETKRAGLFARKRTGNRGDK
jgi:large subunit ribosomal protein L23